MQSAVYRGKSTAHMTPNEYAMTIVKGGIGSIIMHHNVEMFFFLQLGHESWSKVKGRWKAMISWGLEGITESPNVKDRCHTFSKFAISIQLYHLGGLKLNLIASFSGATGVQKIVFSKTFFKFSEAVTIMVHLCAFLSITSKIIILKHTTMQE